MLRMLLEDLKKKLMETDRTGIRMQSTNKYSICDCWHIYMCVCSLATHYQKIERRNRKWQPMETALENRKGKCGSRRWISHLMMTSILASHR